LPVIYKITNKINGKVYIGRTRGTAKDRFERHWRQRYEDKPFYHDLRELGKDGFRLEVLQEVSDDDWTTEYSIIQQYVHDLGIDQVYNVEIAGQACNSHKAIIEKYGSLEAVVHNDACWDKSRKSQIDRYGKLAIHWKSSYEPKSYHFQYDDQEFVGFTDLWKYLREHGYPKIGKTTVKRIAHNPDKIFRSYPELSGKIIILEGLGRRSNG